MTTRDSVVVGRVSGLHGVRGWVKVYSYTDPREGIAAHRRWTVAQRGQAREFDVEQAQRHGSRMIAKLRGIDDRDAAAALVGAEIAIDRSALPETAPGEFYWADLIGLEVETEEGEPLGRVERVFETGANDVLVVTGERERLIPWLYGRVVTEVDLRAKRIRVRWDPEF